MHLKGDKLEITTFRPFHQTIYLRAISIGKVESELLPLIIVVCGDEKVTSSAVYLEANVINNEFIMKSDQIKEIFKSSNEKCGISHG